MQASSPIPALEEQIEFLRRENERLKRTVHNHTQKLDEMQTHLRAVESVIDGMRRGGKRFVARPLEPVEEEG